ncbi:hypothetical protein Dimus_005324 [Dionaea muscipula]
MVGFGEGQLIVEGADYLIDTWDPSRGDDVKEVLASAADSELVDRDYLYFLRKLDGYCDRKAEEEEDVDPQYMLWLDGCKGYRNAYVLEVADGEGKAMYVMYEYKEDESSGGRKRKTPERHARGGALGMDVDSKLNLKERQSRKENKVRTNFGVSRNLSKEEKSDRGLNPSTKPKASCKWGVGAGRNDDAYSMFLDSLRVDGEEIVFVYRDGMEVRYEEDGHGRKSSNSRDGMEVRYEEDDHGRKSSNSRKRPLEADTSTSSDERTEEDRFWHDDQDDANLSFRERVIIRLGKPYDPKELTYLRKLAQQQKLIAYYRDTKRAGQLYTVPGHLGKSYLDCELELQKMFKKVELDDYKVLNLLRGFFFWLQHLPHDDSFKPWTDETCMKMILASGDGGYPR